MTDEHPPGTNGYYDGRVWGDPYARKARLLEAALLSAIRHKGPITAEAALSWLQVDTDIPDHGARLKLNRRLHTSNWIKPRRVNTTFNAGHANRAADSLLTQGLIRRTSGGDQLEAVPPPSQEKNPSPSSSTSPPPQRLTATAGGRHPSSPPPTPSGTPPAASPHPPAPGPDDFAA